MPSASQAATKDKPESNGDPFKISSHTALGVLGNQTVPLRIINSLPPLGTWSLCPWESQPCCPHGAGVLAPLPSLPTTHRAMVSARGLGTLKLFYFDCPGLKNTLERLCFYKPLIQPPYEEERYRPTQMSTTFHCLHTPILIYMTQTYSASHMQTTYFCSFFQIDRVGKNFYAVPHSTGLFM